MDSYISEDTFMSYLNTRLRNARKGADSRGIATHYRADAKSFRDECHLIPKLISCAANGCELSAYEAIQMDYYYWHCVLLHYCWKYEYMDGFFHRMAAHIYSYRDEQLERLVK